MATHRPMILFDPSEVKIINAPGKLGEKWRMAAGTLSVHNASDAPCTLDSMQVFVRYTKGLAARPTPKNPGPSHLRGLLSSLSWLDLPNNALLSAGRTIKTRIRETFTEPYGPARTIQSNSRPERRRHRPHGYLQLY